MANADNALILSALTPADINTSVDGEPRVLDLRLAEVLGFKRRADIRPLIERHADALERLGGIFRTARKSRGRGRPSKEFWLTKKQAIYLAAKSETERATEITIQVVEVFDAVTSGAPVAGVPTLDGRYLVVVNAGRIAGVVDVNGRSIIDGNDPMSLWTFLREDVPVQNLPVALEVIAWRTAAALKHGPKGAPVPAGLKASALMYR